ncbi:MAG: tetratricopeptide repeat protein [Bacteroidales bacterium]|nr:tetratricopeptide repeat protein [Bacteroidales bacterium]
MNRFFSIVMCVLLSGASLFAQEDKKDVRRGNKDYRKSNFKEAEIDYRKALLKDSTSFAATYDLANALYSQKDYEGAANTLEKLSKSAPESQYADRYYFNKGNVSLQKKDYKTAVDDFKQALLRDPGDLQAKESYIYAKKMLENQENGGEGESNKDQQNQDQQNQDQQQDQQDQQPSDGQQDKQEGEGQAQQQQISVQQAQQILKAIQAKEKETQEKVEKAKAQNEKSRQKDKNW